MAAGGNKIVEGGMSSLVAKRNLFHHFDPLSGSFAVANSSGTYTLDTLDICAIRVSTLFRRICRMNRLLTHSRVDLNHWCATEEALHTLQTLMLRLLRTLCECSTQGKGVAA